VVAYIQRMPRKPIEIPPAAARSFAQDIARISRDKRRHQTRRDRGPPGVATERASRPREKKLRVIEVRRMFDEMKDHDSSASP